MGKCDPCGIVLIGVLVYYIQGTVFEGVESKILCSFLFLVAENTLRRTVVYGSVCSFCIKRVGVLMGHLTDRMRFGAELANRRVDKKKVASGNKSSVRST